MDVAALPGTGALPFMSGRTLRICDCSRVATHKTANGWECSECRRIEKDDELSKQVHPQDKPWNVTEEWETSRQRELLYYRIYNRTRR